MQMDQGWDRCLDTAALGTSIFTPPPVPILAFIYDTFVRCTYAGGTHDLPEESLFRFRPKVKH